MGNKIYLKCAIAAICIATIVVRITHKNVNTELFNMNVEALSQDDTSAKQIKYTDISDVTKPIYDFVIVNGEYKDSLVKYTHIIDCKEPNEMFGTYCISPHAEDSHEAANKYECNLPNWFKDE